MCLHLNRSGSCSSTFSPDSAKKPTLKQLKAFHKVSERRMENDSDDPSTQVLVWDCSGHKKLKMPIGELYDKVGKTARPSPIWKHSMRISRIRERQAGAHSQERPCELSRSNFRFVDPPAHTAHLWPISDVIYSGRFVAFTKSLESLNASHSAFVHKCLSFASGSVWNF
jgi:hypothetical protein